MSGAYGFLQMHSAFPVLQETAARGAGLLPGQLTQDLGSGGSPVPTDTGWYREATTSPWGHFAMTWPKSEPCVDHTRFPSHGAGPAVQLRRDTTQVHRDLRPRGL